MPLLHLAAAYDAYGHRSADTLCTHTGQQIIRVTYGYAIQGDERITEEQPSLLGGAIGFDGDQK